MKSIKEFIWFFKASKSYTETGYIEMIFKKQAIKRAIWFCKQCRIDRKMHKKYGESAYLMMDRIM